MKKIVLVSLVALGMTVASLAVVYWFAAGRALAEVHRSDAARAQMIADAVDQTTRIRLTETFTLAALPSLRGLAAADPESRAARSAVANAELQAIAAADPNVRAASITDVSGRVVLTTDDAMNADWSARLYIGEALAGHLHASTPALDSGEISQYYSSPILDNAGEVAGTLVIRVAVQEMWMALGREPSVFVVDENGVKIADITPTPRPFVVVLPLAPAVMQSLIAAGRYGADITTLPVVELSGLAAGLVQKNATPFDYIEADLRRVHATRQGLATNPWSVVVFTREDAVTTAAWEAVREAVIAVMMALVVGAVSTFVLIDAGENPN